MIIGLDPGPTESAYCIVAPDYSILEADKVPNDDFINFFKKRDIKTVAIESIQSYGMPVGREVFDTCYMIGRVIQICSDFRYDRFLYPRPEYTKAICGVSKINDSVVRQSLLLRFGGDKKGEPLYLLKGNSDKRSAFAVAVYHMDLQKHRRNRS